LIQPIFYSTAQMENLVLFGVLFKIKKRKEEREEGEKEGKRREKEGKEGNSSVINRIQ